MDSIGLGATTILGIFIWYLKWSYSKSQDRIENDIKKLFEKVDQIENTMPTRSGVEKLSDDNRDGHKEIWIEIREMGEKLANIKGRMGSNGS